jgi:hypothetical protein
VDHPPRDCLHAEEDRAQVDVEHAVPLRLGQLEERPRLADAGVVEGHVEPPPAFVRRVDHPPDVLRAAHVDLDAGRAAQVTRESLGALAVQVGQQQLGALVRQAAGAGGTDAARGARDQHASVSQSLGHQAFSPDRISRSYRCC